MTAAVTIARGKGMITGIGRCAISVAAFGLVAGCISIGPKAPKELIGLTATTTAPAGVLAGGRLGDGLVVLDPVADRRLDVQRIAVQVDESHVAYLKDSTWVERPARLFRRLLAETIRAKGQRLVLEGNDDEAGAKTTLSGRLIDCGYDARRQAAVVRFDAISQDAKGAIRTQRFESVITGVAPNTASVAPALNRAANEVAAQVADWVG